jgi:hypothetical protein
VCVSYSGAMYNGSSMDAWLEKESF